MTELAAGLAFGLGAGLSPGPLLTLVITTSLDRGFAAGARVAIAPLITDTPIIVLAVAVLSSVSESVLGALGLIGGLVVVAIGIHTAATAGRGPAGDQASATTDVWRGVLVNAFSPHPWIFWVAAGGPALVSGWRRSPAFGVLFLVGFYLLLVGGKVAIAWVVARGGERLDERWRRRLIRGGGAALIVGGLLLVVQAASGGLVA